MPAAMTATTTTTGELRLRIEDQTGQRWPPELSAWLETERCRECGHLMGRAEHHRLLVYPGDHDTIAAAVLGCNPPTGATGRRLDCGR